MGHAAWFGERCCYNYFFFVLCCFVLQRYNTKLVYLCDWWSIILCIIRRAMIERSSRAHWCFIESCYLTSSEDEHVRLSDGPDFFGAKYNKKDYRWCILQGTRHFATPAKAWSIFFCSPRNVCFSSQRHHIHKKPCRNAAITLVQKAPVNRNANIASMVIFLYFSFVTTITVEHGLLLI